MSLFEAILIILLLIIASAVISSAEISLAGARKLKLQAMINEGDQRAEKVLKLQEQPGRFITVVQIGLNMVAILGGVVGESAINPYFSALLSKYTQAEWVDSAASWIAFTLVTSAFVLLADLMPKRIAMTYPEKIAVRTIGIMGFCIFLFKPLVLFFDFIANSLFNLFGVSTVRQDNMTSEDIVAVVDAGEIGRAHV